MNNQLAYYLISTKNGFLLEQPTSLTPLLTSSGSIAGWMFKVAPGKGILSQKAANEPV